MGDAAPLTLAFLDGHPVAAARALSALAPAEAAAYLNHVPDRHIVRVMDHVGPWSASQILQEMDPVNAAAVLRGIDFRQAVVILRFLGGAERERLLEAAPTKLRRDFRSSLEFPDDTAGGHMTLKILAMTGSHTVADALRELGRAKSHEGDPQAVYVTNRQRRLLGVVTAGTLLKQRPDTVLNEIADASIHRISARSRISTLGHLESWDRFPALPVVGPRRNLLGALPRSVLRTEEEESAATAIEGSIPGEIASSFLFAAVELAGMLVDSPAPAAEGKGTR